jgi:hypothetical protein
VVLRALVSDLAGLVAGVDPEAFARRCSSEKREQMEDQLRNVSAWIEQVLGELGREAP